MSWTDGRIAVLRELWAKGHSASQIAQQLGFTRNAVIGKVHRLKLPPRSKNARKPIGERRVSRVRRMSQPAPAPRPAPRPAPTPPQMPPQPVRPPDPDPTTTVAFKDLRPGQCAYILSEHNGPNSPCCGAPTVAGKPYCAEHLRRCVSTVSPSELSTLEAVQ